jgi:hypothetical protein
VRRFLVNLVVGKANQQQEIIAKAIGIETSITAEYIKSYVNEVERQEEA